VYGKIDEPQTAMLVPSTDIGYYTAALENSSHDMWLSLIVARYFYDQEDYDEADRYYRAAVERDNKFVAGYMYRGRNFYRQNKFREAQEMLAKAVELDPLSSKAHNFLAVTLRRLNQYDAALEHHERATKFEPQSPYEYNAFAYTLAEAQRIMPNKDAPRDLNKALDYLRRSEELFGGRREDYAYILEHTRGAIHLAKHNGSTAIGCFWKALKCIDRQQMMPKKKEEKRLEVIYHLGIAHQDLGTQFLPAASSFFVRSRKSPEIDDKQRLPYYWFSDAFDRMHAIASTESITPRPDYRCDVCCRSEYPDTW
jgi:tetratricopeptide (TPR) repeat protein